VRERSQVRITATAERRDFMRKMRNLRHDDGGWVGGGVPLLNNFFSIYFDPISKIHYAGGCLCHPPALWFRGGGRAPASKDSHFCWHKIAGGCYAR
jgi:hypothetical protein